MYDISGIFEFILSLIQIKVKITYNNHENRNNAIPMFQLAVYRMLLLLLLSHFSRVRLPATPWIAAYQAPLSVGFSKQEYWSGVPLPSPKNILQPINKKLFLLVIHR